MYDQLAKMLNFTEKSIKAPVEADYATDSRTRKKNDQKNGDDDGTSMKSNRTRFKSNLIDYRPIIRTSANIFSHKWTRESENSWRTKFSREGTFSRVRFSRWVNLLLHV